MPAAKVCRLTGPGPAVWLQLSMITGGLTLAIVAGVPSVCWGTQDSADALVGVAGAGGALVARHPRLAVAPAAHRKDDLASSLDVWSTHSSSLPAWLL